MSEELVTKDSNAVIARAELDTMIASANAYPRDESKSLEKAIKLATMDEETAQSCFYALPRKGKDNKNVIIEGDSIRLAEIIRCCWKNIHTQTRIVEVAEKHITTEAVCWDLESNNKHVSQDRISIWFGEKAGKGYRANNDMQIMLAKASQAKALRNAIFEIIGKGMVKIVSKAVKSFVIGDSKSLVSKVTKVVDKLIKMGLDKENMLDYFGHTNFTEFTGDDLTALIGIGTALKEGMIKPEEVFSVEKDGNNTSASDRINEMIANKKKPVLEAPIETPIPAINTVTGEVIDSDLPY